jgi:para-nitrobenzyl esterase
MPVYQYEFADRAAPPVMPDPGFELGAVHSAELPYFFPGFTNKRVFDGPVLAPDSQRLAGQMLAWWGAFARNGEPAVPGLPAWERFRGEDAVMRLDVPAPVVFDAGREHQCAFWRSLYPEMLGG